MSVSHEKRSTEGVPSAPAAYSPKSLGVSRPEVRPVQKVAVDEQEEDVPLQMYDGKVSVSKAFSAPAQDKDSRTGAVDIKPFQLKVDKPGLLHVSLNNKGTIQLKEEMSIGGTKYSLGSFRKVEQDTGSPLNADQRLIVTHWMKQKIEFEDNAEFLEELATLLANWEKQKVFYPTETAVTTPQQAGSTVKMYSSRPFADIKKLYLWAVAKRVTLVGFDEFVAAQNPAGAVPDGPFKGHFGDRAHTMKHWNQKKKAGGGVGLLSIDLKAAGATAVKAEKTAGRIAKDGQGYVAGKIALKQEKNFYSAAVGDAKGTWDAMAPNIQQIQLHDWSPKPEPAAEPAAEADADAAPVVGAAGLPGDAAAVPAIGAAGLPGDA